MLPRRIKAAFSSRNLNRKPSADRADTGQALVQIDVKQRKYVYIRGFKVSISKFPDDIDSLYTPGAEADSARNSKSISKD